MTDPTSSPQQLLSKLKALLKTATQTQDLQMVLSPQAEHLAHAVWNSVDNPHTDIDVCHTMGWWHWLRYQALPTGPDQEDLRAAEHLFKSVFLIDPDALPEPLRRHYSQTASALGLQRALTSDDPADLNHAVNALERALSATPADDPARNMYLFVLGSALSTRFWRAGDPNDLERAVTALDTVVKATRDDDPNRPAYLSNLGSALLIRLERTSDTSNTREINRAVTTLEQAVTATPADHPDRPAVLSNLGNALSTRSQLNGDPTDLDRAITAFEMAFTATPASHPARPGYLSNLGSALRARSERTSDPTDLNRAVTALEQAVAATPADHPDRPRMLSNLGNALQTRCERTGDPADLNRAVTALEQAVTATPADHPDRPAHLSNLGKALNARSGHTADLTDLNRAIDVLGQAVTATPINHPHLPRTLSNLGGALNARYGHTGDPADLNRAVTALEQAVTAIPSNHPGRSGVLSNLGNALNARYERTGDPTDLDRAITAYGISVSATPANHHDRAGYLSNLGSALRTRSERTGDTTDLDHAITRLEQAVNVTPTTPPRRPRMQSNLGGALFARYGRTNQITDLNSAVATLEQAVTATPTTHPERPMYLSNLGGALFARYGRTNQITDLNSAVATLEQAVTATPTTHPERPTYLSNLGDALQTRGERTNETTDLNSALQSFQQGASVVSAPPLARATAARGWGQCAGLLGRWPDAAEAYGVALDLFGQVVPGWLERADQEHRLDQLAGIGSEATAACLEAGMSERAVELFEQGHGVLFAQTLDTRTDLTGLADQHPDLAGRLEALSRRLSRPIADMNTGVTEPDAVVPDTQDRRRAYDQMVGLLDQIRGVDGFATFLLPRPVADLLPDQGSGAVVLVNIARLRSDALILTGMGVETIPLPDATPDAVTEQVARLWAALDTLRLSASQEGQADAETRIESVLGWLWDAITEPVLAHLGHTGTPPEGKAWPRVWWCPSGPLAFLPLHAAGCHTHEGTDSVLDRVVSSTIPTIRALQEAQKHISLPTTDEDHLLVVAMPTTPGTDDPDEAALPGVAAETATISALLPGHVDVMGLPGTPAATYETVTAALPSHPWVHFACHAHTNLADPSQSALLLTDHRTAPLTVHDLSGLRLDRADLAVLSACSTALTGARLPDEPIHLSAACQLAGYRHVIATLWPLNDDIAAYATGIIYRHLNTTRDGSSALDADRAAAATHHATRDLRHQLPDRPSLWATLTHTGP